MNIPKTMITTVLLLGFSSLLHAQEMPPGMPPGMQEAMRCMQSIDQKAIQALSAKGKKISSEIKALCKKGDESGARATALRYAMGIKDNKLMKHVNHCTDLMKKAMPNMPVPTMPSAEKYEKDNICDAIK